MILAFTKISERLDGTQKAIVVAWIVLLVLVGIAVTIWEERH